MRYYSLHTPILDDQVFVLEAVLEAGGELCRLCIHLYSSRPVPDVNIVLFTFDFKCFTLFTCLKYKFSPFSSVYMNSSREAVGFLHW